MLDTDANEIEIQRLEDLVKFEGGAKIMTPAYTFQGIKVLQKAAAALMDSPEVREHPDLYALAFKVHENTHNLQRAFVEIHKGVK